MDFVAIDVETANSARASICQIGVVKYSGGVISDEWVTYVDPEGEFGVWQVRVHGIEAQTVKGSPTFSDLVDDLYSFLDGAIVVSHSSFDEQAITKSAARYGVRTPRSKWVDSIAVAKRAWPEFSNRGYKLNQLCDQLGYEFDHHDALADAKAAGNVTICALKHGRLELSGFTGTRRL